MLGHTPLIERRDGRFIVRDQSEIECLLSRAYRGALPLQRLMEGFANVATGDKSWSAFMRGASVWSIYEEDGIFQIEPYRVHPKGYWEPDRDNFIKFPSGTSIDALIDRMIAILQSAAGASTKSSPAAGRKKS